MRRKQCACLIYTILPTRRRRLKRSGLKEEEISYFCDHRNVTPAVYNGRLKQSLLRPVKKAAEPIYRYNII